MTTTTFSDTPKQILPPKAHSWWFFFQLGMMALGAQVADNVVSMDSSPTFLDLLKIFLFCQWKIHYLGSLSFFFLGSLSKSKPTFTLSNPKLPMFWYGVGDPIGFPGVI